MFGFANPKAKLEKKLKQLLEDAYRLSQTNRKLSDEKTAEAEEVRKQLDALDRQPNS
ncbi:MAG: Lacal_2735 family protein [Pirellulaceae bacterium]